MRTFLRLIPLLLLLAGCGGAPVRPPVESPPIDDATAAHHALETGDFHAAARQFGGLAARSASPERESYQLFAAEALIQAGLEPQAEAVLARLDPTRLPRRQAMRHQLLAAAIALTSDPDRTLSLLLQPAAAEAEADLHAQYHHLRARAFALLGNHLEAVREYVRRERFLADPQEVKANQLAIWQALSNLSNEALEQLRVHPAPDVLSGWMELARIAKDFNQTTVQLRERLGTWRADYPYHPALPSFVDGLIEHNRALITRPGQVAVLLPASGRFANAGAAVRDGILAAYYKAPGREAVTLRFYDEGSADEVLARYRQAVADGAEFVIGPLDKEAVRILVEQESLPVPTLALNFADAPHNDNVWQFSLAPEEEARQAAELAWLDGRNRAATLAPEGAWGERLVAAFVERWEELGGNVVARADYDPQRSDFAGPIKSLLNLDQGDDRRFLVSKAIGRKVEFEPRRRQDIDLVFLAAFPRQARLIRPQLRFHHAIGVPVYATSHVFSGAVDAALDRDMDGIRFGDMPWTLGSATPNREVRAARQPLAVHSGALQRLVAMGVDAFHLMPQLKLLDNYQHDRFQGETGNLRVDEANRVRRQVQWAVFRRGIPDIVKWSERGADEYDPRTVDAE